MSKSVIYNVLSIAGSDSGGGAGVQADLKTFSALGVYGASVITAVTAQNTLGVTAVHHVPIGMLKAQIQAVLSDITFNVVKLGMLANVEVIECVAYELKQLKQANKISQVVLDPVMVATSGDVLLPKNAIEALRDLLIPLTAIITPNLPEASVLIGQKIITKGDMEAAIPRLRSLPAESVLLKGGHLEGEESNDLLITGNDHQWISTQRVATNNTHGTGCTLSSAIAAYLAKGETVENAVLNAKAYIQLAIENADCLSVGAGHGPVHHFHEWY